MSGERIQERSTPARKSTAAHLTSHGGAKFAGGRLVGEAVDARRNRALVGQVSGNAALVLGAGSANKGRMENQSIFWCLALGLQRPIFKITRAQKN